MLPSIFFIVNPKSRSGRTEKVWDTKILPEVLSVFPNANWSFTNSPLAASFYASYAKNMGYDIVVAVGGDGTINETVNGLLGNILNSELFLTENIEIFGTQQSILSKKNNLTPLLACMPLGTGCDFVKTLGIPNNIKKSLEIILKQNSISCDVGLIEFKQDNIPKQRYFINIGGCGANGQTIEIINNRKNTLFGKKSSFLIAAIKTLLKNKSFPVEICYDNSETITTDLTVLFVCNGKYCGGGMKVSPQASLQNGKFKIVQVNKMNYLKSIFMMNRLYKGNYSGLEYAITEKEVSSVTIKPQFSELIPTECDGELPGYLPATFSIMPNKISIIANIN
ncbi:diacylglycerol kinase family protein [Pigmentibacter sp. JX0631]|uniref:diacylglycerol/lipid kinase family protein n=1 Tax=Pigmentibacter sp. JX0631 TaxID=2976982 RepID=UPI0024685863|nr:diacylglycerol kinase family protein [Pigmentibacter sp. JX0631]WGL59350.1 diacylglycerol kinase family protein [Pigmentibacter sp. JX0631]